MGTTRLMRTQKGFGFRGLRGFRGSGFRGFGGFRGLRVQGFLYGVLDGIFWRVMCSIM